MLKLRKTFFHTRLGESKKIVMKLFQINNIRSTLTKSALSEISDMKKIILFKSGRPYLKKSGRDFCKPNPDANQ